MAASEAEAEGFFQAVLSELSTNGRPSSSFEWAVFCLSAASLVISAVFAATVGSAVGPGTALHEEYESLGGDGGEDSRGAIADGVLGRHPAFVLAACHGGLIVAAKLLERRMSLLRPDLAEADLRLAVVNIFRSLTEFVVMCCCTIPVMVGVYISPGPGFGPDYFKGALTLAWTVQVAALAFELTSHGGLSSLTWIHHGATILISAAALDELGALSNFYLLQVWAVHGFYASFQFAEHVGEASLRLSSDPKGTRHLLAWSIVGMTIQNVLELVALFVLFAKTYAYMSGAAAVLFAASLLLVFPAQALRPYVSYKVMQLQRSLAPLSDIERVFMEMQRESGSAPSAAPQAEAAEKWELVGSVVDISVQDILSRLEGDEGRCLKTRVSGGNLFVTADLVRQRRSRASFAPRRLAVPAVDGFESVPVPTALRSLGQTFSSALRFTRTSDMMRASNFSRFTDLEEEQASRPAPDQPPPEIETEPEPDEDEEPALEPTGNRSKDLLERWKSWWNDASAEKQPDFTIMEIFSAWGEVSPERPALHWVDERCEVEERLPISQLDARACAVGRLLAKRHGVRPGDRVLLIYPFCLEFFVAFFGVLKCGAIAVPTYPPNPMEIKRGVEAFDKIRRSCGAKVALTDRAFLWFSQLKAFQAKASWGMHGFAKCFQRSRRPLPPGSQEGDRWLKELKFVITQGVKPHKCNANCRKRADDQRLTDTAFLQYTSGSTGDPKGVMVSHANLIHNIKQIMWVTRAGYVSETAALVLWLPLYHDLGLISTLSTLSAGSDVYLTSPIFFIRDPVLWIRMLSKFRGTHTSAPNFGFELAARKFDAARDGQGIDLSCVISLVNGAEAARPRTLRRFVETFGPYGMRGKAVTPSYGLAEHVVFVVNTHTDRKYCPDLSSEQDDFPYTVDEHGRVGVGLPQIGVDLRIVDPSTLQEVPMGVVGEIWISSRSKACGYWDKPEATEEKFGAVLNRCEAAGPGGGYQASRTYLRTGDFGYVTESNLFITGRMKDLIIINGRNVTPTDLEVTAEAAHHEMRPGCCAAIGLTPPGMDEEVCVLVAELRQAQSDYMPVLSAVRTAIGQEHGVTVACVCFIRARTIPKTTSGKIRRFKVREIFEDGTLDVLHSWKQELEEFRESAEVLEVKHHLSVSGTINEISRNELSSVVPKDSSRVEDLMASWKPDPLRESVRLQRIRNSSRVFEVPTGEDAAAPSVRSELPIGVIPQLLGNEASGGDDSRAHQVLQILRTSSGMTGIRMDTKLDTLGLGSIAVAQVAAEIQKQIGIPVDALQLLEPGTTVASFAASLEHVETQRFLPSMQPIDSQGSSGELPKRSFAFAVLQTLGICLIAFLLAVAVIPAWTYGNWVFKELAEPWSVVKVSALGEGTEFYGLAVPLVIPIFIFALTFEVILVKWVVIGSYRPQKIHLWSEAFLRWWWVDRVVATWEVLVGNLILDTPIANVVYRLLGARVSMRAVISTSIREFDLVTAEDDVVLHGKLYCRAIRSDGVWMGRIHLHRGVQIQTGCVVGPDNDVGSHSRFVTMAIVPEATNPNANGIFEGNPSKRVGDIPASGSVPVDTWFEGAKIAHSLLILYFFFLCHIPGKILASETLHFHSSFRYRIFLPVLLFVFASQATAWLACIAAKWILLGRVSPNRSWEDSKYRAWFVDRVFAIIDDRFLPFFQATTEPLMFKLFGANVAASASFIDFAVMRPSEADLVTIGENSFVSACRIQCGGRPVQLGPRASVGLNCVIQGGVQIGEGASVGGMTVVKEDTVLPPPWRLHR